MINNMIKNWRSKLFKLNLKFPIIGKFIKIPGGFIPEELTETDYVFGAGSPLIKKVLAEDGQWTDYLPADEKQQGRTIETMACVSFSLLNCLEILAKKKGFGDWNKSDRYTAVNSGTSRNGNSQSKVIDSVRKIDGSVDESLCPSFVDNFNWGQFYTPIAKDIKDKGITFLNDYEVGYEAVWANTTSIKEALRYSPVWAAGYAWVESGGLYRSYGGANHAFVIVGYVSGSHWIVYDSYKIFIKKLALNYKFYFPKVITLNKRGDNYNISAIRSLIDKGLKFIQRVKDKGQIYEIMNDKLVYKTAEEARDLGIQSLNSTGKLIGVDEKTFNKLLN